MKVWEKFFVPKDKVKEYVLMIVVADIKQCRVVIDFLSKGGDGEFRD